MSEPRFTRAARALHEAHERREPFRPLPPELAPRTSEAAYEIQDAFVALRAEKRGAIAGYKIALASPAMQRFVGVDRPQAGTMFESGLLRSPAVVRASDYLRLIVEFEIAVLLEEDLPAADAPFTRERVAMAVGAVMPAIELADDRQADYGELASHPFELIARPRRGARPRERQRQPRRRRQRRRRHGSSIQFRRLDRRPSRRPQQGTPSRRRRHHRQHHHLQEHEAGRFR
jgi:2-keto-4-pentenoate hydratase